MAARAFGGRPGTRQRAAQARAQGNDPAAPAALSTPILRAALLIKPHSVFCILLVGGLPTEFPTARSVKGECNGRLLRALTG
ncbi:hypothetical protein DF021_07025 [Burkholderia stagnalis]|uniref:Uncharacterized protein n=1 Tax=Burkholderia stagnalis TaxID=1503054 RepID=A0ABX9YU43_9BURK|nr:hypothetical protein DF158_07025 [Burkholderia stagnalis]RQQ70544.1 hypothetical protein DF137_11140 [Burkholderia stagnalis]RQQ71632.1 hypothetical protein DF139_10245 [Burkholderia stagnalis]RQQ83813.1 hypothetical protein DF138_08135 [Burkholderia stagnalis]RQQ92165.1 hypothetical protein DF136_10660 [Burkholderia stagnalis]